MVEFRSDLTKIMEKPLNYSAAAVFYFASLWSANKVAESYFLNLQDKNLPYLALFFGLSLAVSGILFYSSNISDDNLNEPQWRPKTEKQH